MTKTTCFYFGAAIRSFIQITACSVLALTFAAAPAQAKDYSNVISAELLPGWQQKDGTQMAGLALRLAPGWKTYWRMPGDSGIPPRFSWSGSRNVADVDVMFPTPTVFRDAGQRTIGYKNAVVLPLKITPKRQGKDIRIATQVELGICREVCLPHKITISLNLDSFTTTPDPKIAASLASLPVAGAELGVPPASCSIAPGDYGLRLTSRIKVTGKPTEAVVESNDPNIWISEPKTRYDGPYLVTETELMHASGQSFAVNRSGLIFTLFGPDAAYVLKGCS